MSFLLAVSVSTALLAQTEDIEQRFHDLRSIAQPPPLGELPTDQSPIPSDWLGVVSWNIQVGGTSSSVSATRPAMVRSALARLFGGTFHILAAQEISGIANSEVLTGLLPGGAESWIALFADTSDSQDNGFWMKRSVSASAFSTLFSNSTTDSSGRSLFDVSRTTHPPVVATFRIGDFDFTLITVHLTFADGRTAESAREFQHVLDYLDSYFSQPHADPDVIIAGDFNIPTLLSGQVGSGGVFLDSIFEKDPRFQTGNRRLVATGHELTSRSSADQGGLPRNSYDHFILSIDTLEELIQARRVETEVLTADPADPEVRLASDHFPIIALFRTSGEGVTLDAQGSPAAAITAVVNGGSFREGMSFGSWISIFGTGLASTSRTWRDDEFKDESLPTALDGVEVLVNGRAAATFFISPNQLNVQAPDDTALGPVTVEVVRDGATTATAMAEIRSASPGFFVFDPQGRKYLAAVHPDGTLAGPEGLFGGAVVTRPVAPGDVVLLFGTGFGPTEPSVPSGRLFAGAAKLKEPVRVLVSGIQADVLFAGLSSAGLNQLNVRIPDNVSAGDAAVIAETQGYSSQEGAFLHIGTRSTVPAPTVSLSVSATMIGQGQSATLQWTTNNAETVSIDQGIGVVALNGTRIVLPSQSTTYTITAQGAGGTTSSSVTVTVTQGSFGPCGSKTTCGQMVSCAEALFYLNVCKVTRLDADNDGVPCESICPGG